MSDTDAKIIYLEIPVVLSGERLDRALATISGHSRSVVESQISSGSVLLNDRQVKSKSKKVFAGDKLTITNPDIEGLEEVIVREDKTSLKTLDVVFEDGDMVVIDKPAGMVVHRGAGKEADTLASLLMLRYPEIKELVDSCGCDPLRPGIVHRLDKNTSGLLLAAKTPKAYTTLIEAMSGRQIKREYLALVFGLMEHDRGTIDAPIGRSLRMPTTMAVSLQGRQAVTNYEVVKRYFDHGVTLVKVNLLTGRTHQIRVHLTAIGHGVVGDTTYGKKSNNLGLKRQFLHAHRLEFMHPITGENMSFESKLPNDLQEVLSLLDRV